MVKPRRYPRGLAVDFRKLGLEALRTYVARYALDVPRDAAQGELAVAVAHHFESIDCDEDRILTRFFEFLDEGVDSADIAKAREQVAAKTSEAENGAWILAHVISWDPHRERYEVQDEDDASKVVELPPDRVRRLASDDSHVVDLHKGEEVLAIFPETTSFYRAVVSKTPKRGPTGAIVEVTVKFDDDEDDQGRTPHRRVAVRYVLRERLARRPAPLAETNSESRRPHNAAAATYSDMIAHALRKLPRERGNFKEICAIIGEDFVDQLNWKLESDLRKTPVWKSSVRKILFSNSRFTQESDKNVFVFA